MRKLVFGLALATSLIPSAGHAQVTLNMTQVTCANYLAMSSNQARVFSAWMSGWFNRDLGTSRLASTTMLETSPVLGNGAPATRR